MKIQGRIKYPPNWKRKSKFVLRRDGYKCVKCGLGKNDIYVKTGKKVKLDCSHKYHSREFSMVDQLWTLCAADHAKYDANQRRVSWLYKHHEPRLFNV